MFLKIILSIIFSFTIGIVLTISAFLYRPVCNYYSYTKEEVELLRNYLWHEHDPYVTPTTNDIYKKKIDKLLNIHNYKLKVRNLDWCEMAGFSATLFNTIYIDDDITGVYYCITLTHELLHYQYSSDNERYISFMTFKVLYESDDVHLRNASIKWAYNELGYTIKSKYDCKDLLINYFKEKE